MKEKVSILLVGETCFATSREFKGLDCFTETNYYEAGKVLVKALEQQGHQVTQIPCHRVALDFPRTLDELKKYDVILFSDIGSNTFLLLPEVVKQGLRSTNLLRLTKEYVNQGGGFCMIGGYLTYQGMEGKGKWKNSVLEEILPVSLQVGDDRCEVPEGADITFLKKDHPILEGIPLEWPYILGYNKTEIKEGAELLAEFEGDPILAVWESGKGRVAAYTTDCSPHWAPKSFCEWEYYPQFWSNMVCWLAGE